VSEEERTARLLAMAAALEEAIIRFEERTPVETRATVRRLRQLQSEILVALARHERDGAQPLE